MTAQQLRNSILQQAIQGRLVPQDPNDEPICLPKISSVNEEDKEFTTPSNWVWCQLGDVIKISSGDGLTSKQMHGGTIPVYGGNGITGYHDEFNVSAPTVVIGRVGFYCGSVHLTEKYAWITDNAFKTYYSDSVFDTNYLVHFLRYLNLGRHHNATAQPVVSGKKIYPIAISIPPLAEQRRIVAKIEELMPLVEKYGKAQTELDTLNQDLPRRLRQSVLQQAIQGKLVEQDEKDEWSNIFVSKLPKKKYKTNAEWPCEEPFDLPNGWNWCHIGDVCEILNGYAFKSGNYVDSGIRIMRISNVQAGVIVDKDPKFYPLSSEADIKDYVLKEGDMLMSLTGNVGRVGILKADMLPAALNQRVACLRLHNEEIKPFFYHYLQSEIFRMRCESSGHGMAQLNISTEWLKQELIPLPPLAEQCRIVAKIEELFAEIDKLK